jgi:hypothetical protein
MSSAFSAVPAVSSQALAASIAATALPSISPLGRQGQVVFM